MSVFSQCFNIGTADHESSATGDWSNDANWVTTSPGCDISAQGQTAEVNVDMTIFSASCPTFTMSGESSGLQIINNSTLTVEADFNSAGEGVFCIYVQAGSTLIVEGDFILSGESVTLIIEGDMQVLGDFLITNEAATLTVDGNLNISGELNCTSPCEAGSTTFSGGGIITADGGCSGNFDTECSEALPIELILFDASVKVDAVKLTWATATEENFDYFTVERSVDGKNYEALSTLEGKGWSESVINYSYTDNHPLNGRSYYRLKATDLDDTYEYFQPVMVNNFNNNNRAIRMDNNPIGDEPVKFKLNFAPEGDMEITITNLSGVEVYQGNHQPGLSIYSVDAKLDNGLYLIKVKTQEGTYTARFLKK
ncbi:MAG: T9SS type A sorting domain-containing protein [Candidatus Cyclobacteriaceae bacterium M2_1C_046]